MGYTCVRGGQKVVHRTKVKLIDPDLPWDQVAPRPTRYHIRQATRGINQPRANTDTDI